MFSVGFSSTLVAAHCDVCVCVLWFLSFCTNYSVSFLPFILILSCSSSSSVSSVERTLFFCALLFHCVQSAKFDTFDNRLMRLAFRRERDASFLFVLIRRWWCHNHRQTTLQEKSRQTVDLDVGISDPIIIITNTTSSSRESLGKGLKWKAVILCICILHNGRFCSALLTLKSMTMAHLTIIIIINH